MTQQTRQHLQQWHRVVTNRDFELLSELLADNVEFHSPVVWKPKQGHAITLHILTTVIGIFEDFRYHREFIADNSVALEFSATVQDKSIKGVDLIRWNQQGQIDHFEVLLRPLNGLQAMSAIMTEELAKAGFIPRQ